MDKIVTQDCYDEVSKIIATTKYRLPVNKKTDLAVYVVDVRKVMEILKEKFIITPKNKVNGN